LKPFQAVSKCGVKISYSRSSSITRIETKLYKGFKLIKKALTAGLPA